MEEIKKKQVSIWLTPDEEEMLDRIKQHFVRFSDADALRMLIYDAAKKILTENISIEIKTKEKK